MILASRVAEYGGTARKAGSAGAGAQPCKGSATAIADGWVHHQGGGAIHPNGQVVEAVRRLASTGAEKRDQDLLSKILEQLVQGLEGYQPPDVISWGSSDLAFVRVVSVWHFPEFVVLKKTHCPSVPALGPEWDDYLAIPFSDSEGIKELSSRLGLTCTDME